MRKSHLDSKLVPGIVMPCNFKGQTAACRRSGISSTQRASAPQSDCTVYKMTDAKVMRTARGAYTLCRFVYDAAVFIMAMMTPGNLKNAVARRALLKKFTHVAWVQGVHTPYLARGHVRIYIIYHGMTIIIDIIQQDNHHNILSSIWHATARYNSEYENMLVVRALHLPCMIK